MPSVIYGFGKSSAQTYPTRRSGERRAENHQPEGSTDMMRITKTVAVLAVGILAACQTKPAMVERTSEVTATVAAIGSTA